MASRKISKELPSWALHLRDNSNVATSDACSILNIPFDNATSFFKIRGIKSRIFKGKAYYKLCDIKSIIEKEGSL